MCVCVYFQQNIFDKWQLVSLIEISNVEVLYIQITTRTCLIIMGEEVKKLLDPHLTMNLDFQNKLIQVDWKIKTHSSS